MQQIIATKDGGHMPRKKENISDSYFDLFPTRLRKLMKDQSVSQQMVADVIGKKRQAVGYYADGSSSPDWKTIVKLSEFFNVSSDYLLGLSDIASLDIDKQGIARVTGLSEGSIDFLESMKGDDRFYYFFNKIVESTGFVEIFKTLEKTSACFVSAKEWTIKENTETMRRIWKASEEELTEETNRIQDLFDNLEDEDRKDLESWQFEIVRRQTVVARVDKIDMVKFFIQEAQKEFGELIEEIIFDSKEEG